MTTEDLYDPHTLSVEELVWSLKQISILRLWVKAIETEAFRRLMEGKDLPGFKLVEGRANRKWADQAAVKKFLKKLKFSEDDFAPRTLISPAQAEGLLKKRKQRAEIKVLSRWVERPRGKITIAPETDPRDAVTRGEEFTDESLERDETAYEDD